MFKEYVANDIKNTFLNMSEFAEEVTINGTAVTVVEDADTLEYRIKENYGGLIIGDVLFYIDKEQYDKIPSVLPVPTVNQAIRYRGKAYTVTGVKAELGVYEIILQGG